MSGASKILTVSYGTFSCTLEGFDDPFTTMRHIAEYFRDLAAEDRYFGCEPPVPDAETLQQIAQRSIRKRVAAEMQEGSLILRQSTEDVAAASPQAEDGGADASPDPATVSWLPAGMPSASEKLDRIRRAADVARGDGESASITALFETDEEPVEATAEAGEEGVLPAFSEESSPELTQAEPDQPTSLAAETPDEPEALAEQEPEPEALAEPEPEEAFAEPEPESEAEMPAHELAASAVESAVDEVEAPAEEAGAEELAEATGTAEAPMAETEVASAAPTAETAEEVEAAAPADETVTTDVRPEAEADAAATVSEDDADAQADLSAEPAEPLSTLRRARARLARFARREPAPVTETVVERPAETPETAFVDDSPEASDTVEMPAQEAAASLTEETLPEPIVAEAADELPVEAAMDDQADEPAEAEAETSEAEPVADGSSLSSEEEAELEAELAALREDETGLDADEQAAEEDLAAALDTSAPYAPAMAEEQAERETVDADDEPEVQEPAEVEIEVAQPAAEREIAEAPEQDASDQADMPAAEIAASESTDSGRTASPFEPVDEIQEDQALSRLLETADSKLSGSETTRKRNAFQQLKAAVAATFADRQSRTEPEPAEGEGRSAVYRSDLRRATRPVRPPKPERSSDRRPPATPAPGASRPAPLVLVSEQRIDERRGQPAPDHEAVRPRRVLRGTEDLRESVRIAEQTPEDGDSFRDFAERIGANSLSELLEAAAAYTSHVEGRTRFSRAQVMSKIAMIKADDSDGFSREDGLRSFGKLLREGRIRRVQDGQFVINEESRFVQEARTGTL